MRNEVDILDTAGLGVMPDQSTPLSVSVALDNGFGEVDRDGFGTGSVTLTVGVKRKFVAAFPEQGSDRHMLLPRRRLSVAAGMSAIGLGSVPNDEPPLSDEDALKGDETLRVCTSESACIAALREPLPPPLHRSRKIDRIRRKAEKRRSLGGSDPPAPTFSALPPSLHPF
jgi:hypothetical protein